MERSQFTFYASFFRAICQLKKKNEQADAFLAICNYALYGTVPELSGAPVAIFEMARPILDASRKKAEGGKRKKSKDSDKINVRYGEDTAGERQQEQVKEQVQVKVQVKDKEQMFISPSATAEGEIPAAAAGSAVDVFMKKINPTPSTHSMRELLEFEKALSSDVCIKAIDAALDAGARNWQYVKAILERCRADGITSGEEWSRREAQRMDAKARRTAQSKADQSDPVIDTSDTDRLWARFGGEKEADS